MLSLSNAPRDPDAPASNDNAPDGDPTLPPASRWNLLWVERDSIMRRDTGAMLAQLGYRFTFANDAFAAMSLVAEYLHTYDAVVIDTGLADLDGVELAHYLRGLRRDWRLLLCAAGTERDWMQAWLEEAEFPCDALLHKPFDSAQLEHALRRALNAPGTTR